VAPEREREVFSLPRQGGKKSCELGVLRAPLVLVGGAGGGAVGEAGVAHARVAKLELALELGGSVAVEDEELECSGVVGGEGGGADRSRAVHVPRGERLCGVQVEVLAVVVDAEVERSLEVEELCRNHQVPGPGLNTTEPPEPTYNRRRSRISPSGEGRMWRIGRI